MQDFEAQALLTRGLNWHALVVWTLAIALLSLASALPFWAVPRIG